MRHRPVLLTLSALAYGAFAATVAWAVVFLTGIVVPRTVDGPVRVGIAPAVATDVALLLLFAVQHSVMARRPVKRALGRWVPLALERTTFVLATVACLALLFALWQPVEGWVWQVEGPVAALLWAGCVAGWALAIVSTFAVDHLEFLGLRQTGWANSPGRPTRPTLVQGGLYGLVRHPMMSGLLVAFWCTPRMSVGHLLFTVAASGYIAVGIRFEERDLRREIGPDYSRYAQRVPSLVPQVHLGPRAGVAELGTQTTRPSSSDATTGRLPSSSCSTPLPPASRRGWPTSPPRAA